MAKVDRYQLHFGPYKTPLFRYGQRVECEVRGEVILVGLSNGKIPWPLGYVKGNSNRGLVIFKGLAKALRKESAVAVCHWWGVSQDTVSRWRTSMGAEPNTEGTSKLRSANSKRNWPKVGPRLLATPYDPKQIAKLAKAKRGKPAPPHVAELLRTVNVGRKLTAKHRATIRDSQLRRWAEIKKR